MDMFLKKIKRRNLNVYQPVCRRRIGNYFRRSGSVCYCHFVLHNQIQQERKGKMKNPKRLTREQKICLSEHYLDPKEWMLVEETDFFLKLIHKETEKRKTIDKFLRRKKGRT